MKRLLFVNKDGNSQELSRSSPSESAVMLSHVQRNRRKAEGRTQDEPWSGFVSMLHETGGICPEEAESRVPNNDTEVSQPRPSQMPQTYPTSNAYDPFHCTSVGTDAGTHALLQRTFFDVARANFLAEAFAPNPEEESGRARPTHSRHWTIMTERLQRCVDDELLMYTTLAYSSSILGWMTGRFSHGKPPEFFIGKAIPKLLSRINQRPVVDNWLLLSLYSLAVTELWNGLPLMWTGHAGRSTMVSQMAAESLKTSRLHLKAMIRLVTEAGGWHLFDAYIFDSAVLVDKFLAVASMQPPILTLTWDPGPLPESLRVELDTDVSGHSLLGRRLLKEPLAAGLLKTLEDLVEYCKYATAIWSQPESVSTEMETWLFRRLQAIQYRLLVQSHDPGSRYHDGCASLAALVFIGLVIPLPGPQMGARHLGHSLRIAMETMDLQEDYGSEHLRMWYVFVGSLVPGPFEDRDWFLGRLRYHNLHFAGMAEFTTLMREYLFLPSR